MRPAVFAALCLGVLAACDSDSNNQITSVTVQWMDWPAEVNAGEPFRTRIVVWSVCASNPQFRPGAGADQSAVTFSPYFVISKEPIFCVGGAAERLIVAGLDTAGLAPGLQATFSRTYEMRATASANIRAAALLGSFPVRTFGEVTVQPSGADAARRNAAGAVTVERDPTGCARIRPFGLYSPGAALVLEDQADTAGVSNAFVRGYIHDAATPVCGETRVFHLQARN
ncbi:MAG: hypothetical protein ACREMI_03170 [Gemmatimonadales bacterium]